jgi:hypothetical protein
MNRAKVTCQGHVLLQWTWLAAFQHNMKQRSKPCHAPPTVQAWLAAFQHNMNNKFLILCLVHLDWKTFWLCQEKWDVNSISASPTVVVYFNVTNGTTTALYSYNARRWNFLHQRRQIVARAPRLKILLHRTLQTTACCVGTNNIHTLL